MRSCKRFLVAVICTAICSGLYAQTGVANSNRQHAFEMFQQHRQIEALPLFEELALKDPGDAEVLVRLGVCLVTESATLADENAATRERLRARDLLIKAKKLGNTSALLENVLQNLPADGVIKYTASPADQAMRAAEAAFARRDFDEALKNYLKVLEYDPKNYSAALFVGDTYFAEKIWDKAGEWYGRAIEIDPNKETAYRYYADMLLKNGEMEKSRTRAIQAVVAEPYNPITWRELTAWTTANKVELKRVHINVPNNVTQKDENNITITMNANDSSDTSSVWLIYGMVKATWHGDEFKKHYPDEKQYRHSLGEEADALSAAAAVRSESSNSKGKKKGKPATTPANADLDLLTQLYQAKLLEPYVLLSAADQDIAQDYAAYREKNRDKLEKYLGDFILPPAPKP
ncbi:MAG: tetratricopeptide repeat protein [Candidatus Angelobacter sp.]